MYVCLVELCFALYFVESVCVDEVSVMRACAVLFLCLFVVRLRVLVASNHFRGVGRGRNLWVCGCKHECMCVCLCARVDVTTEYISETSELSVFVCEQQHSI
jgi:hypothetical protein